MKNINGLSINNKDQLNHLSFILNKKNMKRCLICGEYKDISEFSTHENRCNNCVKEQEDIINKIHNNMNVKEDLIEVMHNIHNFAISNKSQLTSMSYDFLMSQANRLAKIVDNIG